MKRRIVFVFAWLGITGVSVFVASQAVGALRNQVTDPPATLPTAIALPAVVATTATAGSAPSTVEPSVSLPPDAETSTTTTPQDASPTSTEAPTATSIAPTTTSTAPSPTTTAPPPTTVAPPQMETATYELTGGWVRIRYGGGEVSLVDAAPYAGYTMKPEKTGPVKVEIEFEGNGYEGKFKADMENGELDVEIDEGDDADDD